ncbi:MAG: DUF4965 domain-containing protein [Thermoguttaceae bacterium]|nr:DUF4965 domain-containing protein [Thermoguttaceae bacterium]MDW8078372.1 DUF4965 domain-containing protein [Thermoguttaceae bacterium]
MLPFVCELFFSTIVAGQEPGIEGRLRPPAVPLVVHDPYFSIWSFTDGLADDFPRHWTGRPHALVSMVRVDGRPFRLMGSAPPDVPPMPQIELEVLPTRTIYRWQTPEVRVTLTFLSPILPRRLDVLARPITYLIWEVSAVDGHTHFVDIYYDNSAELAVNEITQPVTWDRGTSGNLLWMRAGTVEQPILAKAGDDLRIDWGYAYVAVPKTPEVRTVIAAHDACRRLFAGTGHIPSDDDRGKPRPANERWPVMACAWSGHVRPDQPMVRKLLLGYDDIWSIQYMGTRLRPWWRRQFADLPALLVPAHEQLPDLLTECEAWDRELLEDARRVGGSGYDQLVALAYRHTFGAHKLVEGPSGEPMLFSKECFSNGCIATVDVIYPASPIFMLFNNQLLKATVLPVLEYAASPRWKFPFAPHDLGTYPLANGQVYGGGETSEEGQMPVEESGNMLIIMYAISLIDGNTSFAGRYWHLLEKWANYLADKGFDPEHQLCTDDFTGPLAHNCNLSIKATVALACYAEMCRLSGKLEEAKRFRKLAEEFAAKWLTAADDGDHFRLAFDRRGTWSQKYNWVWDKIFGLNLFPAAARAKELAFYKRQLLPYGLPLDNRALFTKTDWQVWTATLAEDLEDFRTLMRPVYRFINETPDRVPLTDWYWAHDGRLRGFRARPVIGGVFIKFLDVPNVWKKWRWTGEEK